MMRREEVPSPSDPLSFRSLWVPDLKDIRATERLTVVANPPLQATDHDSKQEAL